MSTLAIISALVASCHIAMSPAQIAEASDYADVESGGSTLAVHLNGPDGGDLHPTTMDEAIAIATRLMAAGRSVDLGLMQLNAAHLGEPGMPRTVAEAMEPCANLRAGVAVLEAAKRQWACIYNTGKPNCSNGYPDRIAAAAARRMNVTQADASPPASAARPPPQPTPVAYDPLMRHARGRDIVFHIKGNPP